MARDHNYHDTLRKILNEGKSLFANGVTPLQTTYRNYQGSICNWFWYFPMIATRNGGSNHRNGNDGNYKKSSNFLRVLISYQTIEEWNEWNQKKNSRCWREENSSTLRAYAANWRLTKFLTFDEGKSTSTCQVKQLTNDRQFFSYLHLILSAQRNLF